MSLASAIVGPKRRPSLRCRVQWTLQERIACRLVGRGAEEVHVPSRAVALTRLTSPAGEGPSKAAGTSSWLRLGRYPDSRPATDQLAKQFRASCASRVFSHRRTERAFSVRRLDLRTAASR